MKIPESPEGWQKAPRPRPQQDSDAKRQSRLIGYVFMTLLLVAGAGAYLFIARDSSLAGAVPLPKALATKSAAHDDLMLVGRALTELSRDAQQRLGFHDAASAAAGERLLKRLDALKAAGRKLEPRLTRDESRSLMAFEQAGRILGDYIRAADDGTGDESLVVQARQQIATGLAAGRGERIEDIILPGHTKLSKTVDDLNNVRRAKIRLVDQ